MLLLKTFVPELDVLRLLDEVIECEFTTIKEINLHSQKTTDIIII